MKWITRFKEGGVDAFKIQPGRGVKPKLSYKQQEEIKNVIAEEGANLTAKKLKIIIEKMGMFKKVCQTEKKVIN